MSQMENIHPIEETVEFTGEKIKGLPVVRYSATVLKKDASISDSLLKRSIIEHLKEKILKFDDELYEVYEINILSE